MRICGYTLAGGGGDTVYTQTADRLTLHFADGHIAEYVRAP